MNDEKLIQRAVRAGWTWHENELIRGYHATGWQNGNTFHNCKVHQKFEYLRGDLYKGNPGRGFDHDLDCHDCGKPIWLYWRFDVDQSLIRLKECYNCNHWLGIIRGAHTHLIIDTERGLCNSTETVKVRCVYRVGPAKEPGPGCGFGGSWYTIRKANGQIIKTCDLWHQGDVPERFLDRLPPNAEFWNDAVDLMKQAAINQEQEELFEKAAEFARHSARQIQAGAKVLKKRRGGK